MKVVCKRRGEEGRRGVWLNFGKREAACIRRRPTWEQWRIKQAIKKEEKEGSADHGDETRKIIITEKNRTPRRRRQRTGRIKNMKIRGRTAGSDTEGVNL